MCEWLAFHANPPPWGNGSGYWILSISILGRIAGHQWPVMVRLWDLVQYTRVVFHLLISSFVPSSSFPLDWHHAWFFHFALLSHRFCRFLFIFNAVIHHLMHFSCIVDTSSYRENLCSLAIGVHADLLESGVRPQLRRDMDVSTWGALIRFGTPIVSVHELPSLDITLKLWTRIQLQHPSAEMKIARE